MYHDSKILKSWVKSNLLGFSYTIIVGISQVDYKISHKKTLQSPFIMDTKFQSDLNCFLKLREQITSMEIKIYHTVLAVK